MPVTYSEPVFCSAPAVTVVDALRLPLPILMRPALPSVPVTAIEPPPAELESTLIRPAPWGETTFERLPLTTRLAAFCTSISPVLVTSWATETVTLSPTESAANASLMVIESGLIAALTDTV